MAVEICEGQFSSAPDENAVGFVFHRPSAVSQSTALPCIVYFHGGGMVAQSCFYGHYRAWARLLARQGVAVLLVDFRNALIPGIVGSPHSSGQVAPYPAGLNDCVSSVRWLRENATRLAVDATRIVVAGESGGGNLAIATALRLKRDGEGALVSGVYAMCPYLLGSWPDAAYPSTTENQGILLSLDGTAAHLYGRAAFEARDPCAWPGFASPADLVGFPRTFVSLNECDPLRDEGAAFYRKLVAAGVPAQCRIVVGTAHGAELFMVMPDVSLSTAQSIGAFAWRQNNLLSEALKARW